MTSARRRPACSWALVGSRSIQMMSPASGALGLPGLVSDGWPPVGLGVVGLGRDAGNQVLQPIAASLPRLRERNLDDQGAILDGQLGALALGRSDLLGNGTRHAQR